MDYETYRAKRITTLKNTICGVGDIVAASGNPAPFGVIAQIIEASASELVVWTCSNKSDLLNTATFLHDQTFACKGFLKFQEVIHKALIGVAEKLVVLEKNTPRMAFGGDGSSGTAFETSLGRRALNPADYAAFVMRDGQPRPNLFGF